ncbi:MAG: 16S rRNA (guanine(966)-N(2))-methyltransferase RsmD [Colwelliaceae bacterium]|nr:16S rRNA (guanine(966)-N(2))-methyltransferase RsmD [Colwelliaceae bacterium]
MKKSRGGKAARTSSTNKASSQIRIIAGRHRGRKLPVLDAEGLRPTTDRVKETVFNWLMPYIQDTRCLDCFSGAGSLGFEALSRGAQQVTMIELNRAAAQQLSTNKALLKADNLDVLNTDALQFLTSNQDEFDLVFIDPPFRQGLAQKSIDCLAKQGLASSALVYVETESESSDLSVPDTWQLLKEKTAGQVTYRLFQCD